MAAFMELTLEDGDPVLVNLDRVVFVRPTSIGDGLTGGSEIYFWGRVGGEVSEWGLTVQETVDVLSKWLGLP